MPQPGPYERRIGERVPTEPIPVTLALRAEARRRRRQGATEIAGWIVDVSISGAGVLAASEPALALRSVVVLVSSDEPSLVVVKRAEPADQPGMTRYGVEFRELGSDLQQVLHRYLQRGRPGEDAWRRSF